MTDYAIVDPGDARDYSRELDHGDATKIDEFWDASPDARQHSDA